MKVLIEGLGILESPRWHEGRLWFCHWGAGEVISVGPDGGHRVETVVPAQFPLCIDWLPDGRLLAVAGMEGLLLRREPDGTLVTHADLGRELFANEIVVDAAGNAYVNSGSFDGRPGRIVLVPPGGGSFTVVAEDIAFGNGMALTPDGSTLIVAESYANCLTAFDVLPDATLGGRRVWASLDGDFPDGICLDPAGDVWYASVPGKQCVLVREGGAVLRRIPLDRGGFACALGDGTLYVCAAEFTDVESARTGPPTGRLLAFPVSG